MVEAAGGDWDSIANGVGINHHGLVMIMTGYEEMERKIEKRASS